MDETTSVIFSGLKNLGSEVCLKIGGAIKSKEWVKETYKKYGVALNAELNDKLAITMRKPTEPEEVTFHLLKDIEKDLDPQSVCLVVPKEIYNRYQQTKQIQNNIENKRGKPGN